MAYIARDDPTAALTWLERPLSRVDSLSTLPDSGCAVPELQRQDIREIIVSPYRVMYRRGADQAEIAAIQHAAREFDHDEIAPGAE